MTFQELKLIPSLLEAVRCCGYQASPQAKQ